MCFNKLGTFIKKTDIVKIDVYEIFETKLKFSDHLSIYYRDKSAMLLQHYTAQIRQFFRQPSQARICKR